MQQQQRQPRQRQQLLLLEVLHVLLSVKTKPNCYPNSFSYYVELRAHTDTYAHLYNLSAEFFPASTSFTPCWSWQRLLLSDKLSAKLVFELFKLVYFMEF